VNTSSLRTSSKRSCGSECVAKVSGSISPLFDKLEQIQFHGYLLVRLSIAPENVDVMFDQLHSVNPEPLSGKSVGIPSRARADLKNSVAWFQVARKTGCFLEIM